MRVCAYIHVMSTVIQYVMFGRVLTCIHCVLWSDIMPEGDQDGNEVYTPDSVRVSPISRVICSVSRRSFMDGICDRRRSYEVL